MAQCFYVVDSLAFVSMKKAAEYALEKEIKLINKYDAKTLQRVKTLEQKVDIIPAAKTECECGKDHEDPFFADSDAEVSSDDETEEPTTETPKVAESKVETKAEPKKGKKKSNKA